MDGGERYLCRPLIIASDYPPTDGAKQTKKDEKDLILLRPSSISSPTLLVTPRTTCVSFSVLLLILVLFSLLLLRFFFFIFVSKSKSIGVYFILYLNL